MQICLYILIFVVINLISISLIVWGSVYVSEAPIPLQECTYLGMSCDLSPETINSGPVQLGKMEFNYINNNGTGLINADYTIYIENSCLYYNPCCACCAVNYNNPATPGSSYYCAVNENEQTIINEWYYNSCGPNIVYVAPLVIGTFIFLVLWIIYICMCCNHFDCDDD